MEVVRVLRNIFLRSFVIGGGFAFGTEIVTIAGWDTLMPLAIRLFHTDAATLTRLTLYFFTALRFFLGYCLLAPGLALHWTLKAEEKRAH